MYNHAHDVLIDGYFTYVEGKTIPQSPITVEFRPFSEMKSEIAWH
jgi:hypothetical protein